MLVFVRLIEFEYVVIPNIPSLSLPVSYGVLFYLLSNGFLNILFARNFGTILFAGTLGLC